MAMVIMMYKDEIAAEPEVPAPRMQERIKDDSMAHFNPGPKRFKLM